jgi:hypothetical protein
MSDTTVNISKLDSDDESEGFCVALWRALGSSGGRAYDPADPHEGSQKSENPVCVQGIIHQTVKNHFPPHVCCTGIYGTIPVER